MSADELQLFSDGEVDAAPMPGREAGKVGPHRIDYIAGVLSQSVWGDEKKTAEQRARAREAARAAVRSLGGEVDA